MLFGPMLIDTLGMNTLFLPDLQYHFHDMDPNWVVNHAYNVASYILEHDNPTYTFLFLRFHAETLYGWSQYLIPNRILVM